MIKQNLRLNRLVKALVLAGVLVSSTLSVSANNNNKLEAAVAAIQPSVQHISADDAATTLLVQFENKNRATFTIIIRDEAGNTLYRNDFNDAAFSKTFRVLNDASGIAQNLFVTVSPQTGKDIVYSVNNTVAMVKSVQVIKH
jgi:hypothetical protein